MIKLGGPKLYFAGAYNTASYAGYIQKTQVFWQAVFQSPSPHSPSGFAARLSKTLFRGRLQYRELRRLSRHLFFSLQSLPYHEIFFEFVARLLIKSYTCNFALTGFEYVLNIP